MRTLLAAVLLFAVGSLPAAAQPADALEAAEALTEAMLGADRWERLVDESLDAQLAGQPELSSYRDVMRAFMLKYMGWAVMKPQVAALYAAHFTAAELREMTAFYRTPTGQKAARLLPELSAQGMQMGQQAVMAHQDELVQALEARQRELEKKNQRP